MSKKSRAEHIAWCKTRAWQEYEFAKESGPARALRAACVSMLSDLGKHSETENMKERAFMRMQTVVDEASLRKFIDGFTG